MRDPRRRPDGPPTLAIVSVLAASGLSVWYGIATGNHELVHFCVTTLMGLLPWFR